MQKTISLMLALLISVICAFSVSGCNKSRTYNQNLYGNTNINMLSGGDIAVQDGIIFFKSKNSIKSFDTYSNKQNTIKKFMLSDPGEISVYGNFIFYKKQNSVVSSSALYRTDWRNGTSKKIIKDTVWNYNVYQNNIYYLSDFQNTTELFTCGLDGKNQTKIISGDVKEFVIRDNYIFYSTDTSIRLYNISDKTDDIVYQSEQYEFFGLHVKDDNIYCSLSLNSDTVGVAKIGISDHSFKRLCKGRYSFVGLVDDNSIIINADGNYKILNLSNGKQTMMFEQYDITDLYVFDSDIYFYALQDETEGLFKSDINRENISQIY